MTRTDLTHDAAPAAVITRCTRGAVLALAVLTLSACGAFDRKPQSVAAGPDFGVISHNLVDVLTQLEPVQPDQTTVQVVSPARNEFERQVQQELTDQGYTLQKVTPAMTETSPNIVSTEVRPASDATASGASVYSVAIGSVKAERQFVIADNTTLPASEVMVLGGNAGAVTLNDADVFKTEDTSFSKVAFTQPVASPAALAPVPSGPGSKADILLQEPKQAPVKWNVYDTLQSNYVELYDDYIDVDRSILVFPNDSLRLGDTNKQIIEQYVGRMDPETDVLSIIGCSHGKTEIDNGNSLLALGRANRVKEAFLFSGVEHEHVLEEGCWAPRTFDEVMPRRGVVLTLKRRKDS